MARSSTSDAKSARCALAAERIELSLDEQKRLDDLYGQFAPFWFSSEARRARTVHYVCECELKRIDSLLGWFDELNDFLSECDDKNDPRYAVVKEAKKNFLDACSELYDAL